MFCTKCGAELPEGAKFCVRCGNSVAGNPAAEHQHSAAENPVAENSVAENTAANNSVAENPAVESPVTGSAPANNSIAGNAAANIAMAGSVVQEKLEAMKPVIGEMGKKLEETAGPAIGEMGKKLGAAAGPAIGAIENKLNVKLDKKKLGIIGAVVVVLVLILALRGGGSKGKAGAGFSSPEEAYEAWTNGFCQQDFDLTLQAEPDFVIEGEGGKSVLKETLQRNRDRDLGTYDNVGISLRYEAIGNYMLEEQFERDEFEQRIKDIYGVDIEISNLAVVDFIRFAIEDGTENLDHSGTSSFAFEYKGKWYYVPMQSDYNFNT